ncbi:MAG: hypothetical protein ACP5OH_07495 [Nitrososphaerota archaeon]
MGNRSWIIFAAILTFPIICIPVVTFAQWPITANPSLVQNGIDDLSGGNSNQTLPSNDTNTEYSNGPP